MTASQCNIWLSDMGPREWWMGEGSESVGFSSWRRLLVDGCGCVREEGGIMRGGRYNINVQREAIKEVWSSSVRRSLM